MMAYLNTGVALGPMVAPLAGGALTIAFGWRSVFAVLSVIAVVLVVIAITLPETHFQRTRSTSARGMLRDFRALVTDPRFSGFAFAFGLQSGTYFVFATVVAYLMTGVLKRTELEYGAFFAIVPLMYLGGNLLSVRLSKWFSSLTLAIAGSALTALAGGIFLAAALLLPMSPWTLFLPMILFQIGQGVMAAPCMTIAIGARPSLIGSAAGLFGFIQTIMPAGFTFLAGLLPLGTSWPMAATLFVTAAASLASVYVGAWGLRNARTG
jgi:DHA1 family bicyclomycin/chloramphenicol resistance-like MFS transporter